MSKDAHHRRFLEDELIVDPTATVDYFVPGPNNRDQWGNRLITSPEFAFPSPEDATRLEKARMLISPAGEEFIKTHPRILRHLDYGLERVRRKIKRQLATVSDLLNASQYHLQIGPEMYLHGITSGSQSHVFRLELPTATSTGVEKYMVKINADASVTPTELSQLYFREMTQTQELASVFATDLEAHKLKLQRFLVATGQMSLTTFEEGKPLRNEAVTNEREKEICNLMSSIKKYIDQQREDGNIVWQNIYTDYIPESLPIVNLLDQPDGTWVWIDPLFYFNANNSSSFRGKPEE